MLIGLGVFAVVAVLAVIVGWALLKRNREIGVNDDGTDAMTDAEFRKIEGFDD